MSTKNKGFSLIELVLVIFIFSIITGVLFGFLSHARNSWYIGGSKVDLQNETRRALHEITKDLRQTRASTITGVPEDNLNHNSIIFQIPTNISDAGVTTWSDPIQYILGGLNNRQILKTDGTTQRVAANDISQLAFRRDPAKANTIYITIIGQKASFLQIAIPQPITITINSEIKMRNL
ncbi:MAG: prepilin-type N-terminal cleavage/methylation domain-containing protein [Candidatus Omnitrophota bacterium]